MLAFIDLLFTIKFFGAFLLLAQS